jgi:hypothetical protein
LVCLAELAVNIPDVTLEVAQDLTEAIKCVPPTLHVVTWSKIICNQQLKKKNEKSKALTDVRISAT